MAFLRDTLTRDNAIWMSRDTDLVAGKYRKMAADPYDFLRGTAGVYYDDLARPDPDRAETTFLTVPEAGSVLIAGDPHPENFGVTLQGPEPDLSVPADTGALGFEVQDLDGSAFGPYLLDVRRGALGIGVLAAGLEGCGDDCINGGVQAFVQAYVDEVIRSVDGATTPSGCTGNDGAIVADLCARGAVDGSEGAELATYTAIDETERHFILDDGLDDAGKGLLPLTEAEDAQLDRVFAAWARRPADLRILDRARRYGVGVASFPALRYVIAWDHGGEGPEDDHLASIREVVDPPGLPGRGATVPVLFDTNAARIEEVAWLLWSRPDADVLMAGVADGGTTFKITTWSGWFQGFDHDDIERGWADGDYAEADLDGLAALIGRTLAGSHARALTDEGTPALDAIAADLGADEALFIEECVADAATDVGRSAADYLLFQEALTTYGPLLGADTPVEDTLR